MKIAFGMGHPAHFHLYKNAIHLLKQKHEVEIFISDKGILRNLLDGKNILYTSIASTKPNENLFAKTNKLFLSTRTLYNNTKNDKPDIFVGCITQLCWVSWLLKGDNIFNAEDDITYTYLQGLITYPFVDTILTSNVVKIWPFAFKRIGYAGYHKLAYLHPNWFIPNESIKNSYIRDSHYFIIRTVNQNAYHDIKAMGLDLKTLRNVVNYLKDYGTVYISSEKPLTDEFQKYALPIKENDIHHVLFFADLFIGDSQSMAVEAAMLGIPSIRYNNFVGRISVLEELENRYGLTFGIKSNQPDKLINKIKELMAIPNLKNEFACRRQKMLSEKIDVTAFLVWFIENWPESFKIMKKNPEYQERFK